MCDPGPDTLQVSTTSRITDHNEVGTCSGMTTASPFLGSDTFTRPGEPAAARPSMIHQDGDAHENGAISSQGFPDAFGNKSRISVARSSSERRIPRAVWISWPQRLPKTSRASSLPAPRGNHPRLDH